MNTERGHLVFVYGTLRKNECNAHVLGNAKCMSEYAWVQGTLFDTGFGYPALTLVDSGRVFGEIYDVDADGLKKLDYLEGYKGPGDENLYERQTYPVVTEDVPVDVIIYTVDHNPSLCKKVIECGDWLKR
ncbi:gamma-glutamylcyclotransferase [Alkalihalobacillus sp. TS-13]|uniref:gamma-glutamylcyclotransferase family protein n=1 Tax=Alkalihalobacillus sp. TS-13 TaxID=2842455 RepID=UPI001C86F1FE|nr:gamma-glutamylcyclotransferase family protein [Alkalihalobacillus sp. TS-13]